MKKNSSLLVLSGFLLFTSCHDLDLNPLSSGATENWYSSETEIEMSVNGLYRGDFWSPYNVLGDCSDDVIHREILCSLELGTLNCQSWYVLN